MLQEYVERESAQPALACVPRKRLQLAGWLWSLFLQRSKNGMSAPIRFDSPRVVGAALQIVH